MNLETAVEKLAELFDADNDELPMRRRRQAAG